MLSLRLRRHLFRVSPAAPAKAVSERASISQFSEPEIESDDETVPNTHAVAGSATEAEKHAEKTASSYSGGEEEDDVNVNVVDSDVPEKGKQVAAEGNMDDSNSSDSSAYLISQSVPSEIAEALGMSHAKLIGGQVVGKIRFESGRHEQDYLAEAGGSFCFPRMERRLILTGTRNAVQCAEDLALKSYVAARCASRLLDAERDQPICIASLEQKARGLEEEKASLEAELAAARASAEKELQAARLEAENAKAEAAELRRSLETKVKELKDAECNEQAVKQAVSA